MNDRNTLSPPMAMALMRPSSSACTKIGGAQIFRSLSSKAKKWVIQAAPAGEVNIPPMHFMHMKASAPRCVIGTIVCVL